MIRKLVAAIAFAGVALGPVASAEEPKFNVSTTPLGAILDAPTAKAAFTKVLPDLAANPDLDQGRSMTLTEISGYVPDQVTPEKLKQLQAEFDKIK
jgi:hypothetical protein